jgi:hypothetical protein
MSAIGSLLGSGFTVAEAIGVLDARQQDAWSRSITDDVDFTHGLRFGMGIEQIDEYTTRRGVTHDN